MVAVVSLIGKLVVSTPKTEVGFIAKKIKIISDLVHHDKVAISMSLF